jgi:hypothetical protein
MCVGNEAPPLLFIGKRVCGLEHQMSPKHTGMQQVTNHGPPCGRPGSHGLEAVRPILGLVDTLVPRVLVCFPEVARMWAP